MALILSIFYIYAIVGMEIFHTNYRIIKNDKSYIDWEYATFNDFTGALLILFQISIEAKYIFILNNII